MKDMPKHLTDLEKLRIRMVQKRYPARLINVISMIYLRGMREWIAGREEADLLRRRLERKAI